MKAATKQKILIGGGLGIAGLLAWALFGKKDKDGQEKPGSSGGSGSGGSGSGGGGNNQLTATPAGVPPKTTLQDPNEIAKTLKLVSDFYGVDIARNVERIYRMETNFKSGQYNATGSAGMVSAGEAFPYGWKSLLPFWESNKAWAPIGKVTFYVPRTGKNWTYLAFSGVGGFMTLAEILENRGNDPGRYASTDPNSDYANWYRQKIASITPKYV